MSLFTKQSRLVPLTCCHHRYDQFHLFQRCCHREVHETIDFRPATKFFRHQLVLVCPAVFQEVYPSELDGLSTSLVLDERVRHSFHNFHLVQPPSDVFSAFLLRSIDNLDTFRKTLACSGLK